MKVFVTGAKSFIGKHTIDELVKQGHQVIPENKFLDKSVEAVLHLALWPTSAENITGFLNLLEQCKERSIKFVYASSSSVYGSQGGVTPLNEFSSYTAPINLLGADYLTFDMYAQLYNKLYRMKNVGLRYFNVYGVGSSSVIEKFIKQSLSSQNINIFGDGEHIRNFIYVEDVAKINVAVLTGKDNFRNYSGIVNVGAPECTKSINEMIKVMNNLLPELLTIVRKNPVYGDIRILNPDLSVLLNMLPDMVFTNLEDGISRLIQSSQNK